MPDSTCIIPLLNVDLKKKRVIKMCLCLQRSQGFIVSLPVITYVLVSVALLCLVVALLVFLCVKGLHCNSNSIHINLVFVMFTTLLIFLCGIDKAEHEVSKLRVSRINKTKDDPLGSANRKISFIQ